MSRRAGPALLLAATLAGCASTPEALWSDGGPHDWNLSASHGDQRLSLGVEGTEIVDVILDCFADRPGDVDVNWFLVGEDVRDPVSLQTTSGDASHALTGTRIDGEEYGPWVVARTTSQDPVLRAFARSGRLSIDGVKLDAVSAPERKAVADFFTACAAAPALTGAGR